MSCITLTSTVERFPASSKDKLALFGLAEFNLIRNTLCLYHNAAYLVSQENLARNIAHTKTSRLLFKVSLRTTQFAVNRQDSAAVDGAIETQNVQQFVQKTCFTWILQRPISSYAHSGSVDSQLNMHIVVLPYDNAKGQ